MNGSISTAYHIYNSSAAVTSASSELGQQQASKGEVPEEIDLEYRIEPVDSQGRHWALWSNGCTVNAGIANEKVDM